MCGGLYTAFLKEKKWAGYTQDDRKYLLQCTRVSQGVSFEGYTTGYGAVVSGYPNEIEGILRYSTNAIGRSSIYDLRFEYEQVFFFEWCFF